MLLGLVLISVFIYVLVDSEFLIKQCVLFMGWMRTHPYEGPITLIFLFAFTTLCFIPTIILNTGAGFVFYHNYDQQLFPTLIVGTLVIMLGYMLGSTCQLLLGRYVFRAKARQLMDSSMFMRALERGVEKKGWQMLFVLQLSPFTPMWLLAYAFGVTAVSVWQWVLGCQGMLLLIVFYVYLGTTVVDIQMYFDGKEEMSDNVWYELAWPLLGLLVTIYAISYSMRLTRKMIKELEEEESLKGEISDLEWPAQQRLM